MYLLDLIDNWNLVNISVGGDRCQASIKEKYLRKEEVETEDRRFFPPDPSLRKDKTRTVAGGVCRVTEEDFSMFLR